MAETVSFRQPSWPERLLNQLFGVLVGLGLSLSHNYLIQVRGRKSGRLYATPVNLLVIDDDKYVVAPRGNTGWVRNAKASGEIWLKKGRRREHFYVKEIGDEHKPLLLKAYLEQFHTTVQRYFPVPAGSDAAAFVAIAPRYPVFKLERAQG